jgi:Zn-dependent oligopeptidase
VNARHVNEALIMLRQVGLSVFDMKVHRSFTDDELDSLSVGGNYNDCRNMYGLIDGPDVSGEPRDWGNAHATTIHFMENQAAAYYSYL